MAPLILGLFLLALAVGNRVYLIRRAARLVAEAIDTEVTVAWLRSMKADPR